MFSIPPATAQEVYPERISSAALAIACAPEPHTRFTVSAGTRTGSPPPIAAWRAGFIFTPAWITLPMTTVSTSVRPEAFNVPRIAAAPSSGAATSLSEPPKVPRAVRTGLQITISRADMVDLRGGAEMILAHTTDVDTVISMYKAVKLRG